MMPNISLYFLCLLKVVLICPLFFSNFRSNLVFSIAYFFWLPPGWIHLNISPHFLHYVNLLLLLLLKLFVNILSSPFLNQIDFLSYLQSSSTRFLLYFYSDLILLHEDQCKPKVAQVYQHQFLWFFLFLFSNKILKIRPLTLYKCYIEYIFLKLIKFRLIRAFLHPRLSFSFVNCFLFRFYPYLFLPFSFI